METSPKYKVNNELHTMEIHLSDYHCRLLFELINELEANGPSDLVALALDNLREDKPNKDLTSLAVLNSLENTALQTLGLVKALQNLRKG